jgi:glycosyltransferase involved in cell wall biosynthesis
VRTQETYWRGGAEPWNRARRPLCFAGDGEPEQSEQVNFLIDAHHVGGHQTGNETIARNIGRELATLTNPGELVFAACAAGRAEVEGISGSPPRLVSDSSVRRVAVDLPRLARRSGSDALLVQYTKPLTRRPCVVMIHDLSPFDAQSAAWLSRRFRLRVRASINRSARTAALLVACSEFTRRGLITRYSLDPERVVLAPSAVDPELATLLDTVTPSDRRRDRQRVIAVGNVVPRKNLSILGSALADLRANGMEVELRVVGGIPAAGTPIAADLRRMLGDAVSFTGYVSREQLAGEYADADALAFPSLFEGFGIPAVEAMYAAVPVIVSDAGSLPEVVGDAGMVVPSTDREAWRAGLARLLGDAALRSTIGQLGQERARATNWRSSAEVVLAALRKAAGQRPHRGTSQASR